MADEVKSSGSDANKDSTVNQTTHDASSSWNGYTYQGKVAIYTTLKYINFYIQGQNAHKINSLKLEIEHLEDFSILESNNYISLHQVKAKPEVKTIGGYKAANIELLGKLANDNNIKEVNLHTASKLKDFDQDEIYSGIKDFDVSNKKKSLSKYKDLIIEESTFDQLFKKFRVSTDGGIFPHQGDIHFERAIKFKDIKDMILFEIQTYYSKQSDDLNSTQFQNEENREFMYSNFINLIDEVVMSQHQKENPEGKILIDFTQFTQILNNKSVFDMTPKTISSLLLSDIIDQYYTYYIDYELEDEPSELLKFHLDQLKIFNAENFFLLCRKLATQISLQHKEKATLSELRNLMEPSAVREIFLHAIIELAEVINLPEEPKTSYNIHSKHLFFSLSTLQGSGPSAYKNRGESIIKNLKTDDDMFALLYDIDGYINKDIDNEFEGSITKIQSDIDSNIVTNHDNRDSITDPKNIKFISINTFKKEYLDD